MSPNTDTIDPSIEELMADSAGYWLAIDTSDAAQPYISCVVRQISGTVKVRTFGATVAEAINAALEIYRVPGFSSQSIWFEKPEQPVPGNTTYTDLDRIILEHGAWIVAERKGEKIWMFVGVCHKPFTKASDRSGASFLETYALMVNDVKEYLSRK